jgi:hypothetical protein
LILSVQVAARQWPSLQLPVVQSALELHTKPVPHALHEPPQSTSDSLPLRTLSVQLGGWQTVAQTRVAQSLPVPQRLSTAHGVHVPPQSTSLSVSFFLPSEHVAGMGAGVAHSDATQVTLLQSASWVQCSLNGPGSQLPPQSTSVSEPLASPSVQVGAATQMPASHKPLSQSVGAVQLAPSAHTGQSPPHDLPAVICAVQASTIGLVVTGSGAMPKLGTEQAPSITSASEQRETRLIPDTKRSQLGINRQ